LGKTLTKKTTGTGTGGAPKKKTKIVKKEDPTHLEREKQKKGPKRAGRNSDLTGKGEVTWGMDPKEG